MKKALKGFRLSLVLYKSRHGHYFCYPQSIHLESYFNSTEDSAVCTPTSHRHNQASSLKKYP